MFLSLLAFFVFIPLNTNAIDLDSPVGENNTLGGTRSASAHVFSLKAYDCNQLNASFKCINDSGTIISNPTELNNGDNIGVGKVIKVETYYELGPTPDLGMQWGIVYDPTYVEPALKPDGTLYTYMNKKTVPNGGIWPPEDIYDDEKKDKIEAVVITATGKETEKPNGIITSRDLLEVALAEE